MTDKKLSISLYGKLNQIFISRGVVSVLGNPSHITIYTNDSMSSVAVGACDAKNVMSFQVPYKLPNRKVVICSKQFMSELLKVNKLDYEKTYRIEGVFLEEKKMVTFDIGNAQIHSRKEKEVSPLMLS